MKLKPINVFVESKATLKLREWWIIFGCVILMWNYARYDSIESLGIAFCFIGFLNRE